MSSLLPIIAIVGPTASGKTELAIKLAKKFRGVIISADSRQIYKGLPIGTNQPIGKWQIANGKGRKVFSKTKIYFVKGVPYFFIDLLPPNKRYSVAQFQKAVYQLLPKLLTSSYLPILVGGTGLYVSSIIEGYQLPAGQPSLASRKRLERLTTSLLLRQLKSRDPITYQTIDRRNRRRIVRALEYGLATGQSFTLAQHKQPYPRALVLGLNPPRTKLYQRINQRVDKMIKQGLIKEVKWLLKHFPQSPALATIGYQELVPMLKHGADLKLATELIKQHTRQFAKRQITWFKRLPQVHWLTSPTRAKALVRGFLHRVPQRS